VNEGLGGLSEEQDIVGQRRTCEQAHVRIKTGVGEEGRQGAECEHEAGVGGECKEGLVWGVCRVPYEH
jgi:hypothetical protein